MKNRLTKRPLDVPHAIHGDVKRNVRMAIHMHVRSQLSNLRLQRGRPDSLRANQWEEEKLYSIRGI